jgi:hypothetical protein
MGHVIPGSRGKGQKEKQESWLGGIASVRAHLADTTSLTVLETRNPKLEI